MHARPFRPVSGTTCRPLGPARVCCALAGYDSLFFLDAAWMAEGKRKLDWATAHSEPQTVAKSRNTASNISNFIGESDTGSVDYKCYFVINMRYPDAADRLKRALLLKFRENDGCLHAQCYGPEISM